MNWNQDVGKIVYPLIAVAVIGYNGYNYYSTYKINQFVEKYNHNSEIVQEVFGSLSKKSEQKMMQALSGKQVDLSLSVNNSDVLKLKTSTEDILVNGCNKLESAEKECTSVYSKLLDIIALMENGTITDLDGYTEKTNAFASDARTFQLNVMADNLGK